MSGALASSERGTRWDNGEVTRKTDDVERDQWTVGLYPLYVLNRKDAVDTR
jgi:hypothetical protein